jgi:hypothetical protein
MQALFEVISPPPGVDDRDLGIIGNDCFRHTAGAERVDVRTDPVRQCLGPTGRLVHLFRDWIDVPSRNLRSLSGSPVEKF